MASPKRLQILIHSISDFEIRALDVLASEFMLLEHEEAWDVEGWMEGSVPEPSSSEDESTSAINGPTNDAAPAVAPPDLDS